MLFFLRTAEKAKSLQIIDSQAFFTYNKKFLKYSNAGSNLAACSFFTPPELLKF
jgi:hypothetical protein